MIRFLRTSTLTSTAIVLLALVGCSDDGSNFDVTQQLGPDPVLPEPRNELLPDLKVAEVVGWQEGETPIVAEGLTITP
ncbi:MAG TPA: sorbosone dehydrogenase family protein, partial [Pseudorhizobium sp.]|nr:sorbosone dehydrogenase family protein [Pseudorhizobium sp.]